MKFKYLKIIFIFGLLAISLYFFGNKNNQKSNTNIEKKQTITEKLPDTKTVPVEITKGSTYGSLMATSGVAYAISTDIYNAAQPLYDLVKIRQGRIINLIYDYKTDNLKELRYKIDSEDELIVSKKLISSTSNEISTNTPLNAWQAEIKPIPYEIKIKTASGIVETSMYEAAIKNDIDIRAIINLADAFQWSIDFAMDPRVGDSFKLIYEERYLNGKYIMPGQILAGKYINNGETHYVYYFKESEDNIGFFDENGNSVQKMFLKAPVAFKYISSGYTTGPRVIMEFGLVGPHRAIDYAAPIGTPIRAVGDGTVIYTGWKTGYGNFTSLRHNSTYTTNYAHQSKIIVKRGQKVKQGETIGYVGSTGYSTGPHLHFEMVKNGVKINPLKEILPPGKPIKDENKERFFEKIKEWQELLK